MFALVCSPTFATRALDVNDQLSIGGILAAAGQCQSVSALLPAESYGEELLDDSDAPLLDPVTDDPLLDDTMDPFDNECRGAMPFQLEISYHPNDSNEVFVNSGSYGLPSYDAGAALEWAYGPWSLNGIGMNVGENDDGNNFNFWGVQAAYQADTALGPGNYRIILAGTSTAFLDPTETKKERRLAGGLSFDQEHGDVVGGFLRVAWQNDDAIVDYKSLYLGGLNFNGSAWNRDEDSISLGYAYLDGGNAGMNSSQVFETYYRAALNEYFAITADVQYMDDDLFEVDPRQDDPNGWIFGMRLTAEF
jgi:hypothetical protein